MTYEEHASAHPQLRKYIEKARIWRLWTYKLGVIGNDAKQIRFVGTPQCCVHYV